MSNVISFIVVAVSAYGEITAQFKKGWKVKKVYRSPEGELIEELFLEIYRHDKLIQTAHVTKERDSKVIVPNAHILPGFVMNSLDKIAHFQAWKVNKANGLWDYRKPPYKVV